MEDLNKAAESFNILVASLEMCQAKGAFTLDQALETQKAILEVSGYLKQKLSEVTDTPAGAN